MTLTDTSLKARGLAMQLADARKALAAAQTAREALGHDLPRLNATAAAEARATFRQRHVAPHLAKRDAFRAALPDVIGTARREAAPRTLDVLLSDPVKGAAMIDLLQRLPAAMQVQAAGRSDPIAAAAARIVAAQHTDMAHAQALIDAGTPALTRDTTAIRDSVAAVLDQLDEFERALASVEHGDAAIFDGRAMLDRAYARDAVLKSLGFGDVPTTADPLSVLTGNTVPAQDADDMEDAA